MSESGPSPAGVPGHLAGRVGRYELVEALGKGAMGVVYHARDPLLDRDVALKVMLPQIAGEPEQKHRFEREARAAAKLVHPNVVTVFDFGYHTDGSPYIAMELLRGQDLLHAMREGPPLSLETKISLIAQTLDGLGHAHQAGVVHRDIKPANVFLTQDGAVKIMDFGVARLGASAATGTGTVVGTVEYMSPEQVRGARVDGRSDLFSTASMLCELVSGKRPFQADTLVTILYKITHEEPEIELPPGDEHDALFPLLSKGLAKNADERYATAAEFAKDLRLCLRALAERAPAVATEAAAAPLLDAAQAASTAPALERPPAPPAVAPPPASVRPADPVPLFRLLREIYVGGKSGHLHFSHDDGRRSLRWLSGHIVMGTSDVAGEHLGDVLVRYGWLRQDDLDRAAEIILRDRKPLGGILSEMGLLPRERLTEAVALHVREILFNVAGRPDGSFAFEETAADSMMALGQPERIAPGQMILEATRRIQDAEIVRRGLGDIDGVLALSTQPLLRIQNLELTPTDGFLMSRVDGMLTAREVFQIIPLPEDEVERSLFGLLSAGTLEYVQEGPRTRSPGSGTIRVRRPTPIPEPAKNSASPPATGSVPSATGPTTPPSDAAGGRAQPGTSSSQAALDLEAERLRREQERQAVDALRKQICEAYEGLATKTHFEVLGVSPDAGPDETKQAYFRLARPFHPDTRHHPSLDDLKPKREEVFLRLREAYDTLRDPASRRRYEGTLGPHRLRALRTQIAEAAAAGQAATATPPASVEAAPPEAPPDPETLRAQAVAGATEALQQAARHLAEHKYWDAIQLLEPIVAGMDGTLRLKARLGLARAYKKNVNWLKRAEEQLLIVLEEDGRCVEAYVLLGQVYHAGNLNHRAQAMYRKALEIAPTHEEALRELATLGHVVNPQDHRGLLDKLLGRG
jgi:tetratricopeptide (TPR) repeat protein